jgi:hypothetical protein
MRPILKHSDLQRRSGNSIAAPLSDFWQRIEDAEPLHQLRTVHFQRWLATFFKIVAFIFMTPRLTR